MAGKKKQSIPLSPKAFRGLFLWSHWVVPLVAAFVIFAHIFWCLELSWQLIVLIGVVLLPFLLPLLFIYVGKIGTIEMRDDIFQPETEDKTLPPETTTQQPGASTLQEPEPTRIPTGPHFMALTGEERKMLRTLWRVQSQYISQGKRELWGFKVGESSPDYREFVRGFSTLNERGLVNQDARGLAFLTNVGIKYCQLNSDLIEKEGDAWTQFVSA
ncbi:MAG TPA: hypothetical protein VGM58_01715 [Verrucomicrobiae bacterium]